MLTRNFYIYCLLFYYFEFDLTVRYIIYFDAVNINLGSSTST